MGATPEPERENREQEWHETPHQAGSSQIRHRESKIYPGFCNRAASTVVDGSPGWWGFRELKSSAPRCFQWVKKEDRGKSGTHELMKRNGGK
jgi:hypothetical protein